MRTIVDLTDEQIEHLQRLCERKQISRAEAVRRGIDLLITQEQEKELKFRRALDSVFGMWKDRGIDSLEYERELREEWERDPGA